MLKKFKRGCVWYLRGTVKGVRVYETTGTSNADRAEEIRIKRENEILHRTIHGDRGGHTFAEAALMYLDRPGGLPDTEARYVFPLVDHFGQLTLDKIDQASTDRYVAERHPSAKPSTILRSTLTPLTSILNHAHGLAWCDAPKFRRPKQPPGRTKWLTEDQAEQLIGATAPHFRPFVIALIYTGARVSEALYLDWTDIDLHRRAVTFRDTKNGETRTVPLHERAFLALANLPHREGAVFLTQRGVPYSRRSMGGGQIQTAWRGACKRAGLSGFRAHDCRHTFASWLVMAGTPLRTVADLLGHKTLSMVMRYAHLSEDHRREHIASLPSGAEIVQSQRESIKQAKLQ